MDRAHRYVLRLSVWMFQDPLFCIEKQATQLLLPKGRARYFVPIDEDGNRFSSTYVREQIAKSYQRSEQHSFIRLLTHVREISFQMECGHNGF